MIFLHEPLHRALISKGEISPRAGGIRTGLKTTVLLANYPNALNLSPLAFPHDFLFRESVNKRRRLDDFAQVLSNEPSQEVLIATRTEAVALPHSDRNYYM